MRIKFQPFKRSFIFISLPPFIYIIRVLNDSSKNRFCINMQLPDHFDKTTGVLQVNEDVLVLFDIQVLSCQFGYID